MAEGVGAQPGAEREAVAQRNVAAAVPLEDGPPEDFPAGAPGDAAPQKRDADEGSGEGISVPSQAPARARLPPDG